MKSGNKTGGNKTNAMRILDSKKIPYLSHEYNPDSTLSGEDIAKILGENAAWVYKTLVTQGKSGSYYVFVVPVKAELDLKKAARASGEKSIQMIKQKELLPLTGYVHGGCSPIGMKKQFKTFVDKTAMDNEHIFVSAGRVGTQVELTPEDLLCASEAALADIAEKEEKTI